ncbi:Derepression protein [Serratia bockelmannii]|uniref:Derepression protein n=1 Tax=Serratia bockelmannii TaxID=2703793 RepID=UPI00313D76C5
MKPINANEISGAVIQHLSSESYHKLNRARNVAFHMHLHLRDPEHNSMCFLWVPDIFSYINEDISSVLQEVKRLGICDNFLVQSAPESQK